MAKANTKTNAAGAPLADADKAAFAADAAAPAATSTSNAIDPAAPAAEPAVRKDVVPQRYRDQYAGTNGTNGDFIASELSAIFKDSGTASLGAIKAENGIPALLWNSLNPGMQRMNTANRLRAAYLRGETIKMMGKEHSIRHQADEFGETIDHTNATQIGKFIGYVDLADNSRTRAAIVKLFGPQKEVKARLTPEQREAAKAEKKAAADAAKAEKAEAAAKAKAEKAATAKAEADAVAKAKADKAAAVEAAKVEKAEAAAKAKADKAAAVEAAKAKKAEAAAAAKAAA